MTGKLRGIHTLNGCNAITERTGMGNKQRIFEYVSAFRQLPKEEVGTGIFG
jgi:hypothetical protein